jgi:FkbM family methyltransferase
MKIFLHLLFSTKQHLVINSKTFANKIYLRKDQSDPFIFEQIFCEQQYNLAELTDYKVLSENKVKWIIDAGANIGLAAIYFSEKYPNARIISIEPNVENFALLQKNTTNYKNVICLNAALWYQNEDLHISNMDEKSAGFMIESKTDSVVEIIKSVTITQLIDQYNIEEISILKIDIEGSEKELFENGSSAWLPKCHCVITELHDWLKPGTSQVFFREMSNYNWITYVKGENIFCLKPELK